MIRIIDYSDTKIRVIESPKSIFFMDKENTTVSADGGNLVLKDGAFIKIYDFNRVAAPKKNTLDELVISIQQFLDNV